jgi:hypothetical protein
VSPNSIPLSSLGRRLFSDRPQPAETLAQSATVQADRAASLADALNAGQRLPDGARILCPFDDGGTMRAIFEDAVAGR